jgi:hypothetical protein
MSLPVVSLSRPKRAVVVGQVAVGDLVVRWRGRSIAVRLAQRGGPRRRGPGRVGSGRVGDRLVPRPAPSVFGNVGAVVTISEPGGDVLEVGADHDPAPDRGGVHRVVVAVETDVVAKTGSSRASC